MKNLFIITILFVLLIVSGCAKQGLSQSELFDKKQECADMRERIQSEQVIGAFVAEVFYSKKKNTCLYVLKNHGAKLLIDRFNDYGMNSIYNASGEYRCEETFKDLEENRNDCLSESREFDKKVESLK